MTEGLEDIRRRIDGARQLGLVVGAMQGLASARSQHARSQVEAVDAYSRTVIRAIAEALAMGGGPAPEGRAAAQKRCVIVFGAEQGFAGGYPEAVADAAQEAGPAAALLFLGTRSLMLAAERGIEPDWQLELPTHPAGVPRAANTVTEELYRRIARDGIDAVEVVFARTDAGPGVPVRRDSILPFDWSLVEVHTVSEPPLANLPPDILVERLVGHYLFVRLCHAALHAIAAENDARMTAMAQTRRQVERKLEAFHARERQLRQEEITAEIIELAAGRAASQAARKAAGEGRNTTEGGRLRFLRE